MSDADGAPSPARDLGARLAERIAAEGPISLAAFMSEALFDPRAGYYATRDPIGAGADYVTAPEVSQMFGELIGVWAVHCWREMGEPDAFDLVELGPGRGVMMADLLRAARIRPGFLAAAQVTLVEASPALQAVQAGVLASAPIGLRWSVRLETVARGRPLILIANEFLDCLPVRQFVRLADGWRERLVGLAPEDAGRLAFTFAAAPASSPEIALLPETLREAPEGAIVETRPGVGPLLDELGRRLNAQPGRALFVDYGPAESEPGDTFQAIRAHASKDPLGAPGERDLTARVDFAELAREARSRGLAVAGPMAQGRWLAALGLEARAEALIRARPRSRSAIVAQARRIAGPQTMGELFKALCVSSPSLPPPVGFAHG